MARRIDAYLKDLLPPDKLEFYSVLRDFADNEIAPHVLEWERSGGIAGFCDSLTIYLSG